MERCSKCQKSFSVRNNVADKLKCGFCGDFFHGACQNIYDAAVLTYVCSGKHIIWSCERCESKREFVLNFLNNIDELQKNYCDQAKCLLDLTNQVKKIGEDLNEMRKESQTKVPAMPSAPNVEKSLAEIIVNNQSRSSSTAKKSKNSASNRKPVKQKDPVIVIQHKMGKNCENLIEDSLKKVLNPMIDPVYGMKKTSKNKVVISCKDETSFNTYKEKISTILGSSYAVDKPKESKLILKFVGVPDIDSVQLLKCIGDQNNCVDIVQYLRVKRVSRDVAYIECDNDNTYRMLLSKKKVYVVWNVVRVQPYLNLLRCYNCQQFGHTYGECDINTKRVCPKCAGEHDIIQCDSEVICCINCKRENASGRTNQTDHFAWSGKCPLVIKELAKCSKA